MNVPLRRMRFTVAVPDVSSKTSSIVDAVAVGGETVISWLEFEDRPARRHSRRQAVDGDFHFNVQPMRRET
jgi:hypothetical protein